MTQIILALIGAAAVSFTVYLVRERIGGWGFLLAMFRTVGLGSLVILLLNPGFLRRVEGGPVTVLLDASLSMGLGAGDWEAAIDTAMALAGVDGTIIRFGSTVSLFDSAPPDQGLSMLRDALLAGIGGGGATVIVTDGEVGDVAAISGSLLGRAGVVRLGRDTVPDAALLDVSVPAYVGSRDSIRVNLTVGTWGEVNSVRGAVEVRVGDDLIASSTIGIPLSPGVARRSFTIPPNSLQSGTNVLYFKLLVDGDMEPRDDVRVRVVTVTDEPDIVVLVAPADWEGRFLFREVARVAQTGVRGFAQVQDGLWIEMRTSSRVGFTEVAIVADRASVVLSRGSHGIDLGRKPTWYWPAASDTTLELFEGEWYPRLPEASSPISGRLVGIAWDSVPPLTGVVPLIPTASQWVGLTSRKGRRGAERPVLLGTSSSGVRGLTTVGVGFWRWAFRGGEPLEAYRALISAGVDWLLGAEVLRRETPFTISQVVKRGEPITISWHSDSIPESVALSLNSSDSTWQISVPIDANSVGKFRLEPGVFAWSSVTGGALNGIVVVESYSDEFPPGQVTLDATSDVVGEYLVEGNFRDRWWLFLALVVAFAGEWAVRQKRGLP